MRKLISYLLLTAALAGAVYQWHTKKDQLRAAFSVARTRLFPCSSPVTYSIGKIDPGYPVSPEELAAALKEAETAWENQARRNLFEFRRENGDVAVNLVYDKRQASLDRLKSLGISTDHTLDSYKTLKARFDQLSARVDREEADFKGIMYRYKQREAAYNAEIRRLNERGTATRTEASRADTARRKLSMQFDGIKMIEKALNADVDTLNALGTTLNQLIVQLNINVAQYNRAGSAIGRFEEGLYRVNNGRQSIELYKYTDREQLVSLLAHELGHALGLDHVPGADSLMYPVNKGGKPRLSGQDIAELNRACRIN
ncbi:MAG: matrixin family metalloprotease [Elusimicrobia bacterium]|nr:matrixin family metalloprotease [Elusimicrobiota bacterium]